MLRAGLFYKLTAGGDTYRSPPPNNLPAPHAAEVRQENEHFFERIDEYIAEAPATDLNPQHPEVEQHLTGHNPNETMPGEETRDRQKRWNRRI